MPVIHTFLKERGLQLSGEKTNITRIEDGFDFLGQRVRKYGKKFMTTPSKSSVKSLLAKIKRIIYSHLGQPTSTMIEAAQLRNKGMGELSQACLFQENLSLYRYLHLHYAVELGTEEARQQRKTMDKETLF